MPKDRNLAEYQRGYNAGRRRTANEAANARRDMFAAAALQGLLVTNRPWGTTTDGVFKPNADADAYARTARTIANAMMKALP